MFFVLSKTLAFLLKPIGILFILTLFNLSLKNRTKNKRMTIGFLVILYIFSCPAIINYMLKMYEFPTHEIVNSKNYEFGIVLTGGLINESKSLGDNIHLGPQSDRLWQTAELYKAKKITKIMISGGDGFHKIDPLIPTENDKSRDFLIKVGVNPEDIIQEKKAINTHENAKFSKQLLPNYKKTVLVITSAFHLKRALACFEKEKLKADWYATSPISRNYNFKLQDLIPSSGTLSDAETIANELVGMVVYKFMGYI
ncbi:YdcF family protein [Lacihabitans sp. CS3-21]|uniref:YdcF family protein n=1 Tax=Lacihabitans sp. CS3-21 TaxID=2487332 RepID=UPI0020CC3DD2|nr:YdcF family protein [Lacihabitans sp. CS3-21]MCP9746673.1 YdcF family protein [Lacihabitans sp. CS3-21]